MKRTGWATTVSALAASAAIAGGAVGPASAEEVPTTDPPPDPEVVAQREASAMAVLPPGYDNPPDVQPAPTGATARMRDLYYLSAKQTTGGYIELAARDNPAQDKPGALTTTMRIYGNAASFRSGPGDLGLRSQFTCTGTKVDGVTIGTSGVSVTGGIGSKTLTWSSLRNTTSVLRQYYTEGGHFRCKVSNLSPAKTTRRGIASAHYKYGDTRAEDSYSFTW
jgi:hypothetical protein